MRPSKRIWLLRAVTLFILILTPGIETGESSRSSGKKPEEQASPRFAPGEIIIKFKNGLFKESQAVQHFLHSLNVETREVLPVFHGIHALTLQGWSEEGILHKTISSLRKASPGRVFQAFPPPRGLSNVYRVILENEKIDIIRICTQLGKDPSMEYVEPNFVIRSLTIPDDPYYHSSGTWGLHLGLRFMAERPPPSQGFQQCLEREAREENIF